MYFSSVDRWSDELKIAVTGAGGYIGGTLISSIERRGMIPVALSRRRPISSCEWRAYDLSLTDVSLPEDVSCIVHLAMDYNLATEQDIERELNASLLLARKAKSLGAKFIFLSSQTAREDAVTNYGKTKWLIEQALDPDAIIIRPGMVYGGHASGLFLQLAQFLDKLPLAPHFLPSPKLQPIHVEDLCEGILIALCENYSGVLCLASPQEIDFHIFLKFLSKYRLRKAFWSVPVPRFILDFVRRLLPSHPTLIRLHSLFTLPYLNSADDMVKLGLQLRGLDDGMHLSGNLRRRYIFMEAQILFRYLIGSPPSIKMLKLYCNYVEMNEGNAVLVFSKIFQCAPWLLVSVERSSGALDEQIFKEFGKRLAVALAIYEASPVGAGRFLRLGEKNNFLYAILICIKAVSFEVFSRIASFFLKGFIRKVLHLKVYE